MSTNKVPENWHEFKCSIELRSCCETHPRFQGEKQELFRGFSYESTEIEYLDLLHSFVVALKLLNVLETGTNMGISTFAIAYALKYNSENGAENGKLFTIEIEQNTSDYAKQNIESHSLDQFVKFYVGDSIDIIDKAPWKTPFNIVFFDSSRHIRPKEFHQLKAKNLLTSGSFLFFHDTCKCKIKNSENDVEVQARYIAAVNHIAEKAKGVCRLKLSRGLTICQL
jgi:predicted O-methyltransferase YrrM